MSVFEYFGIIIRNGKNVFYQFTCINNNFHTANYYNPEQGRIETLVFRLPRYRLFLGVMGMSKEFKVGEGKEKKVWDEAHFVWLYKHLCIALQLKRCLLHKRFSAFRTMLPP